jgi:hypothetical protein
MAALPPMARPAAALLALLAGARPPDAHASPGHPTRSCQEVEGRIDARAARLGLDLHGFKVTGGGSIQGALEGGLRLEVRREGRSGTETEIAVLINAETAAGPLRMQGTALAGRPHASDPLHRVHGWLDVSEPTAAGALGRVRVEGTADTDARVIAIRYRGELCGVAAIQLAAARGNVR